MFRGYLKWKEDYAVSLIGGVRTMCDLCTKLHEESFYEKKVILNFRDWFLNKFQCMDGNLFPPWIIKNNIR